MSKYVIRAGETRDEQWDLHITPDDAGWTYCGLRTATLSEGQSTRVTTNDDEVILVPLEGSYSVDVEDGDRWQLAGRENVFAGPTDVLYVPRDTAVTVTALTAGRFAIPSARAVNRHPVQYLPASDVPVFVRGAGQWSRHVRDFGNASVLTADRLIAVEVVNPGGNWSGIPRHKHDTPSDTESQLEEIYYFEAAPTPGGAGYGMIRVSSSEAGEIEVAEEVRFGDAVLVPFGWHGPVTAPPETDLYYLNVMAGSTGRDWNITNNDEDAWVTKRWEELEPDPCTRLNQ